MLRLTVKLILPLTIISFAFFTKWWYASVIDAPNTMYWGFPFIYAGNAWHTSMAIQFFIREFIIDVLVYFGFWFALIWCIDRFIVKLKLYEAVAVSLWVVSVLIVALTVMIWSNSDNLFSFRRDHDVTILSTEYRFF